MAQFASDNFAGTDATELSAYNSAWTRRPTTSTNCQIISGRLRASGLNPSEYYHSGTPASADYTVEVDLYVASLVAGVSAGVFGRGSTDGNNSYSANYHVSNGWRLYKQVGGTFTQLGASVPQTLTAGNTYRIKLEMIGSAIKVYADGVQVLSSIDTAVTAAGKAGIRIYDNTSAPGDAKNFHLDNFSADDPSVGITLVGATSTQVNPSSSVAISIDGAFTGSPSVQENSSSSVSITMPQTLSGEDTTDIGSSSEGSIVVSHVMIVANSIQNSIAQDGSIIIAEGEVTLTGSACYQVNLSSDNVSETTANNNTLVIRYIVN